MIIEQFLEEKEIISPKGNENNKVRPNIFKVVKRPSRRLIVTVINKFIMYSFITL